MESSTRYTHTRDDMLEVVGTQLFGLLILVLATVIVGTDYVGATAEYGIRLSLPFSGLILLALAGFGLWTSASIATRSRRDWFEPRARTAIITSLCQALATCLVVAMIGSALAGWRVDLMTVGQSILVWLCYGLVIGSALQAAIAFVALAFLLTGRELPDIED